MSDEQLIATPGVFGENGNFLLERELGRGGMGGVYMGRDKMLDRPVAVKVMLREYGNDPEFVEKFKKEAQAAARLIHPNIAQVYSYGISDGMPYIAMELVAGGSLDGLMKVHGADIEVPRVMKICEQVAQALRCAADQGLVHGDVKPENVLLDSNGNAKLVDFGLAAMQKDTNEIWGTPYYIAPEKVLKEPVDYRADMYSLGGTIYHALTGVAPFEGDDAVAVVRKRFEVPPPKPSEVRPGLSPQIDYLVTKMLARNPQDRYPSFEALLDDFKKVMTKGLTGTQSVAAAAMAGAEMESSGTGGKRLKLKSKRKFTVHRQPTGSQEDAVDDIPEVDENGEPITASRKFKTTRNLTAGDGGEASYDDEDYQNDIYREQLINEMRFSLENEEFEVWFQPKYDISADPPLIASAEALVRWRHPKRGMISPGVFIPLFEENGMIQSLDHFVWEKAASYIRGWRDDFGHSVPISVNASRIDLFNHVLPELLVCILERYGLGTEDRLHLSGGVLDLRVLVDHIDHRVGTVGEFVHIVTIVTGIAAVRGEERPVGELGVAAGLSEAVQTHTVQHPVVLGATTLVTKHHVLDVGVCSGQGDLHGRLALEEATRIISIGVLLQELFIVAGNGNYQCEKDE